MLAADPRSGGFIPDLASSRRRSGREDCCCRHCPFFPAAGEDLSPSAGRSLADEICSASACIYGLSSSISTTSASCRSFFLISLAAGQISIVFPVADNLIADRNSPNQNPSPLLPFTAAVEALLPMDAATAVASRPSSLLPAKTRSSVGEPFCRRSASARISLLLDLHPATNACPDPC